MKIAQTEIQIVKDRHHIIVNVIIRAVDSVGVRSNTETEQGES